MKVTFNFIHLRKKNWAAGNCYAIPTLLISWEKENKSFTLTLKWLLFAAAIIFSKHDGKEN